MSSSASVATSPARAPAAATEAQPAAVAAAPPADAAAPPADAAATTAAAASGATTFTTDGVPIAPSGEYAASWLSRTFFGWVTPLFVKGNSAPLAQSDLLGVGEGDSPVAVSREFERLLDEEVARGAPQPVKAALLRQFKAPMLRAGAVKFVNSTLNFAPSLMLYGLLASMQGAASANSLYGYVPPWSGYVFAVAMFVALALRTQVENTYFHMVVRVGFRIRTALTTAVYRKALRMSPVARQESPVGQIVNLMQLDAQRIDTLMMQLHVSWDAWYQIAGYMVLLGVYVGPSALAGLATMLLLMPLQGYMMGVMGRYRRAIAKCTDTRVKVTNEVLQGIRAVKVYSWEEAYGEIVGKAREEELASIRAYAHAAAWNNTVMTIAPTAVAVVTLVVFAATGGNFTAARVFSAISVLNQLRFPLMFLPGVIQQIAEARVSLSRLDRFVKQPEVEAYIRRIGDGTAAEAPDAVAVPVDGAAPPATATAGDVPGIAITNATFYWENPDARVVRLKAKADEEAARLAKEAAAAAKKKKGGNKAGDSKKGAPIGASSGTLNAGGRPLATLSTPGLQPGAAAAGTTRAAAPSVVVSAASGEGAPASASAAAPGSVAASGAEPWTVALPPALSGVTFAVPKGKLYAVIGPVGSGKSALCGALLGELSKAEGDVSVSGRIAYVAQTAWILNSSLRRNVTFAYEAATGRPADEARYQRILDVCQLRRDIAVLINGDATEIGERGITLSGGQKQRVSVARAAYSGADVILFDDPLSALDAEVGKALFEQCICDELEGTTRLLVTNQLQYLRQCDGVIVLERGPDGGGRVAMQGTFNELSARPEFAAMLTAYGESGSGATEGEDGGAGEGGGAAAVRASRRDLTKSQKSLVAQQTPAVPGGKSAAGEDGAAAPTAKLMTAEEKNEGAVPFRVWWRYFKVAGWVKTTVFILFMAYAVNQFSQLVSQWWLTFWSSDQFYVFHPQGFYMGLYAAIGFGGGVFAYVRVMVQMLASIRSSRALHKQLLATIMHAPLAFYDTTPLGRVLARFSKDIDAVDSQLAQTLGMLGFSIMWLFGSLAAMIFSTPWFALVVPVVVWLYLRIMRYFRNTAREVKRWDSITRSPIYAHFSESLGGLSTIRAYGLGGHFATENERRVATNISSWYTLKSCDRWLSVRLENLGNFVVLAAALLAVGTNTNNGTGSAAGLAGFSLSFAMAVTALANWLVRTFAEAEQQMNSVERIAYYIDTVTPEPYEAPVEGPGAPAPPASPKSKAAPPVVAAPATPAAAEGGDVEKGTASPAPAPTPAPATTSTAVVPYVAPDLHTAPPHYKGTYGSEGMRVEFKDYRMRYRDDTPEVLHGVNFVVNPGEHVGVVGRTGSGKSSLMVSLFRLIADNCTSGAIELDGVPTRTLSLRDLRRALAIIPQDATMFSGTVRSNLDPVGAVASRLRKAHGHDAATAAAKADEALWSALERVGLKEVVEGRPGGLDAPVAELGEGFSQGQRQLLALARILVRPARLVLLDEASSSLDFSSDAQLQRALREAFPGHTATMLVIAHRLNTIIALDKVLVMDGGRVAEFDTPHALLSNPSSVFSALVEEMGAQTASSLRSSARFAFESRRSLKPGVGKSLPPIVMEAAAEDDDEGNNNNSAQ